MGDATTVIPYLESFLKQWKLIGVDAKGRSGGLALGWNFRFVKLLNTQGFDFWLGVNIFQEELGRCFTILNVYGPYQDQVTFWDNLLKKDFMSNNDIVLGGDLNFSIGMVESWVPRTCPDPLSDVFGHFLSENGLVDISPIKIFPSWCKK
jgi:hypothetical protein